MTPDPRQSATREDDPRDENTPPFTACSCEGECDCDGPAEEIPEMDVEADNDEYRQWSRR